MSWIAYVLLGVGSISFITLTFLLFTSKFYSAEADDFLQKHYDEDMK